MDCAVCMTRLATTRCTVRDCHGCVNSSNRKESSTDSTAGAASSKRPCPDGRATGKEKRAGALGSLKPVGNTARRKVRGAENRVRPTLEDKVRALDLFLKSMSGVAIAKDMVIGVSTLYGWRAKEADIRQQAAVSMTGAKTTKGAEFAKVEQAVMEMLLQARALRMLVNRDAIQAFGRKARRALEIAASTDAERVQYSGFNASEGWVKNVDDEAIADCLRVIRETCAQYAPECVYSADDTGLCYRIMPKATYLAPSELKNTVRGVKAKEPRCFKIRGSPINEKVLLIMDNHISHADLVDPKEQAKERKVIRGCMGLAEGAQPHILDAAELGLEAWKEVLPETIKRCDVGKNIRNKESLEELMDLVQRLSLETKKTTVDEHLGEALKGLGFAPGATPPRASMEAVQTWLRVEEKEGVAEAIIADLKDDLCEESLAHLNMDQLNIDSDDDEADSSAGDEGQCTQPLVSPRPPPYADVRI
ncbi:unnamed protein product [Ectocarpus sp. CCAP 1310/34]|nr:unnamed protein product [Ectocarpus sp. CCAP 1310/34]